MLFRSGSKKLSITAIVSICKELGLVVDIWWWYMAAVVVAVVVYGYGSVVVYGHGLVVVYGYGFGAVVVGDRGDDDGAVAA